MRARWPYILSGRGCEDCEVIGRCCSTAGCAIYGLGFQKLAVRQGLVHAAAAVRDGTVGAPRARGNMPGRPGHSSDCHKTPIRHIPPDLPVFPEDIGHAGSRSTQVSPERCVRSRSPGCFCPPRSCRRLPPRPSPSAASPMSTRAWSASAACPPTCATSSARPSAPAPAWRSIRRPGPRRPTAMRARSFCCRIAATTSKAPPITARASTSFRSRSSRSKIRPRCRPTHARAASSRSSTTPSC